MSAATMTAPPRGGLLSTVKKGRERKPPRLFLYGTPGIGKSTFASTMPDPVFIQTEEGADEIDVAKFPIAGDFEDVHDQLESLRLESHDYRTVVVDTADWLERMIWDEVAKRESKQSIADIGYQNGYKIALKWWDEIIRQLSLLRDQGMLVCILAHSKTDKVEDPEHPTYTQYAPKLHKDACAKLTEWCDAVLFAHRRVSIRKDKSKGEERNIATAIGNGERRMRCVGSPTCIAKNRYGISEDLPLSWPEFVDACKEIETNG